LVVQSLCGLEYAVVHPWEPTAALDDRDEPLLAGIAQRLRAHGRLDRFGVKLIRNPLGVSRARATSRDV
jgi:hypothetical protein